MHADADANTNANTNSKISLLLKHVLCDYSVAWAKTRATPSSSVVVGKLDAHTDGIYQADGGQMGLAWPQASALQQPRKPLPQTW
jgi:hypothetical protein